MGKKKKSSPQKPPERFFGFDDDEDDIRAARPGAFKFGGVRAGTRAGAGGFSSGQNLKNLFQKVRGKVLASQPGGSSHRAPPSGRDRSSGGGGGNPR